MFSLIRKKKKNPKITFFICYVLFRFNCFFFLPRFSYVFLLFPPQLTLISWHQHEQLRKCFSKEPNEFTDNNTFFSRVLIHPWILYFCFLFLSSFEPLKFSFVPSSKKYSCITERPNNLTQILRQTPRSETVQGAREKVTRTTLKKVTTCSLMFFFS